MFRLEKNLIKQAKTFMNINCSRSYNSFKVAVVGASRPLGQSVSLLLKQNPLVNRLTVFDTSDEIFGIAMDLSHIPREPIIESSIHKMDLALHGSDIVVVTGGQPKKQGKTDLCLFEENADFIIAAMQEVAANCPNAFVVIATEPINYVIPLASKVLKTNYAYNKCKVLGVTLLDTMRAHALVTNQCQIPWQEVKIPVICGHSSTTVVPLLSYLAPKVKINKSTASNLTEAIRSADDNVTSCIGEAGESTLSAAYATYCTASAILEALNGFTTKQVAFVANNDYNTNFFSSPVIITSQGISETIEFKVQTALEEEYISKSIKQLADEVRSGELYCTAVKEPSNEKIGVNQTF